MPMVDVTCSGCGWTGERDRWNWRTPCPECGRTRRLFSEGAGCPETGWVILEGGPGPLDGGALFTGRTRVLERGVTVGERTFRILRYERTARTGTVRGYRDELVEDCPVYAYVGMREPSEAADPYAAPLPKRGGMAGMLLDQEPEQKPNESRTGEQDGA